jgi:hypothetical protein
MSLIFQFFWFNWNLWGWVGWRNFDGVSWNWIFTRLLYYLPFGSIPLTLFKRDHNKRLIRAYKVCAWRATLFRRGFHLWVQNFFECCSVQFFTELLTPKKVSLLLHIIWNNCQSPFFLKIEEILKMKGKLGEIC